MCLNGSDSLHAYENTVSMISVWCKETFLELNVCKTKELCIDFRTSGQFDGSLCIDGEAVEVTDTSIYLDITLDNKLTFGPHVQGVYNKRQQRQYMLRKLRSFHVDTKLLVLQEYYRVIIDILLYLFFSLLCLSQTKTCLFICKTACKVIGLPTQLVSS